MSLCGFYMMEFYITFRYGFRSGEAMEVRFPEGSSQSTADDLDLLRGIYSEA